MPLRFKETAKSRTFSVDAKGASITLEFFVYRTDDETELYDAILANTEPVYDGLIRTSIQAPESLGGGFWLVKVDYGDPGGSGDGGGAGSGGTPVGTEPSTPSDMPTGDSPLDPVSQGLEFTFDAGAETKHITQSKQTMSSKRRLGGTPRDLKGAIGVDKSGTVHGCDIFAPKSEFTITTQRTTVTLNYFRKVRDLVATFNSTTWAGFPRGEVLYLGCNAQGTQRGQWTMNHKFAAAENRTDVEICDGFTCDAVGAWEYMWVSYEPDPATGLPTPETVYVERVYDAGDFIDLEIGV